jgi:hypothetical protein
MLSTPLPPSSSVRHLFFLSSSTCFSDPASFYMFFILCKTKQAIVFQLKNYFHPLFAPTHQIRNLNLTGLEHATEHCHRFRSKAKYLLFSISITSKIKKSHPTTEPSCRQVQKGRSTLLDAGILPLVSWTLYVHLRLTASYNCRIAFPHLDSTLGPIHPSFSERRWNNYTLRMVPPLPPTNLHNFHHGSIKKVFFYFTERYKQYLQQPSWGKWKKDRKKDAVLVCV